MHSFLYEFCTFLASLLGASSTEENKLKWKRNLHLNYISHFMFGVIEVTGDFLRFCQYVSQSKCLVKLIAYDYEHDENGVKRSTLNSYQTSYATQTQSCTSIKYFFASKKKISKRQNFFIFYKNSFGRHACRPTRMRRTAWRTCS